MLIDHLDVGALVNDVKHTACVDVQVVAPDHNLDIGLTVFIAVNIDFYIVLAEPFMNSHVSEVYLVLELVIEES